MKLKQKTEACLVLGRTGVSDEIIRICNQVAKSENRKEAMKAAGRIAIIAEGAEGAGCDDYWKLMVMRGRLEQEGNFLSMINSAEWEATKS